MVWGVICGELVWYGVIRGELEWNGVKWGRKPSSVKSYGVLCVKCAVRCERVVWYGAYCVMWNGMW